MDMNGMYNKPEHVLIREIGDEALLLNTVNEKYYSLNTVGLDLYTLLVEGRTLDTAIQSVTEKYNDVSAAQIRNDCTALVGDLENNGLLDPR